MKELRKSVLNINGVIFNIYSYHIEDIEKYFKEFIVCSDKDVVSTYNIFFEKDEEEFRKLYSKFDKDKSTLIDTFKNQQHYRLDNKFMIDSEDYICVRESEFDFKLFTNGSRYSEKYLIRVIREILIRVLETNGYFYMHGTGIEIYDKGILLLGESSSGKTTFATRLNEINTPQKFLSNDRVFLKKDEMCYFPLPIIYAMGTVKSCRELDNYFRDTHVLETRRNGNYILARSNTKCDIPLTDIREIFPHIQNVSSMKVDVVIFPKIDGDSVVVSELDENEIKSRLNASNFTPEDTESKRREWLVHRNILLEEIEENKRRLNEYLIRNKKIFEVTYSKSSTKKEIVKELIKKI
ncbi:MAG: hypothetical protein PUA68_01855 [Bacilli bacterium]|nr:hypothetical protein [Bacilli bacterium]